MPDARQLLEFPHSHFCEKARWALDYKGLPYERRSLLPGWHFRVVRRVAPRTSVPVLLDGPDAVQGSSDIITYLDKKHPERLLTIPGRESEHREFERRIDAEAGVNIRAFLYDRMLDDGATIRHYFGHRLPAHQRLVLRLGYPVLRHLIRRSYCPDAAAVAKARGGLERLLDQLDGVVERQPYFIGDRFSRADITVASLLSFLTMPPEHPVPWRPVRNEEIAAFLRQAGERPIARWINGLYQMHRRP